MRVKMGEINLITNKFGKEVPVFCYGIEVTDTDNYEEAYEKAYAKACEMFYEDSEIYLEKNDWC